MRKAAADLEFEEAGRLRDEIRRLEADELGLATEQSRAPVLGPFHRGQAGHAQDPLRQAAIDPDGEEAVMRRWPGVVLAAFVLAPAAPAAACSVAQGYRVPSNFELVHRADLIVLARVASGPAEMSPSEEAQVVLEPIRALKGWLPAEPLRVQGRVGWNREVALRPSPTPLRAPHFSALAGACIRLHYPQGALVVAMFERVPDGLRQIGSPFARAVEDVEGEDGLWVRAVMAYAAAQTGVDEPGLRNAAELLRGAYARRRDDLAAQAMADDLQAWLDATAPGGPVRRGGAVWRWTGGTDGAGVTIHGWAPGSAAGFRCTAGEAAIRADIVNVEGAPRLALAIGDRRFEAQGEARTAMIEGGEQVSARSPSRPSWRP